jgi:hypothetical protein
MNSLHCHICGLPHELQTSQVASSEVSRSMWISYRVVTGEHLLHQSRKFPVDLLRE